MVVIKVLFDSVFWLSQMERSRLPRIDRVLLHSIEFIFSFIEVLWVFKVGCCNLAILQVACLVLVSTRCFDCGSLNTCIRLEKVC